METPTPVTAVDIGELRDMAPGQLVDSISQLPQFFNTQTAQRGGTTFTTASGVHAVPLAEFCLLAMLAH